jgi:hypothetical protein
LRGADVSPGAEIVDTQAQAPPPPISSQRRSYFPEHTRPGAERVYGYGNTGIEDDTDTIMIGENDEGTTEPSPPTFPARLLNEQEEENCAVQNFLKNTVVADIVPEVAPRNRGWKWKFACVFLALILIVVAIVLVVTLPRDSTVSPSVLFDLLSSVSSDQGEALRNSSTPQSMAFNWMVTNNTNLGTLSDYQLIQRYALATLYYSTNGDGWTDNKYWLDNDEECGRWYAYYGQLNCTTTGELSDLILGYNNLTGSIPKEIGLLTSLGEFIE